MFSGPLATTRLYCAPIIQHDATLHSNHSRELQGHWADSRPEHFLMLNTSLLGPAVGVCVCVCVRVCACMCDIRAYNMHITICLNRYICNPHHHPCIFNSTSTTHTQTHIHTHIHIFSHARARTHARTHTHIDTLAHTHTHAHTHRHTHTRACARIYTHTHIHTHRPGGRRRRH